MPRLGGNGKLGRLDGQQIGRFLNLLLDAFDSFQSFDEMLLLYCTQNRQILAGPNNLRAIILEVINNAESGSWTAELLQGALNAMPSHVPLLEFAQQFGLSCIVQPVNQLERLIRETNVFFDVALWLARVHEISTQICRIEVPVPGGSVFGTGFLLGPNVVMTNYHVVEKVIGGQVKPEEVIFLFDYKRLSDGQILNPGKPYCLSKDEKWLLHFSKYSNLDALIDIGGKTPNEDELDFALLRVDGTPGDERKWIELPDKMPTFLPNMALFIMQHPKEWPLKLALDTQAIIGTNQNNTRVKYRTNTEVGSSGSPCFDANWQLVALHHSGDPDYSNFHKPEYNQGIPIDAIINLLKKEDKLKLLGKQDGVERSIPKSKIDTASNRLENPNFPQVIYSSPTPQPPKTVGREKEKHNLIRFIRNENPETLEMTFANITGAPGIGKTALAAHVCNDLKKFRLVWVKSESFSDIDEILAKLSIHLDSQELTLPKLRKKLNQEKLLIVFDQAENLASSVLSGLLDNLDPRSPGKIILTSQKSTGRSTELKITLEPLSESASQKMLIRTWGKVSASLNEFQMIDVKTICENYLGGIPIQIETIGGWAKKGNYERLTLMIKTLGQSNLPSFSNEDEFESQYLSIIQSNFKTIKSVFDNLPPGTKDLLSRMALIGATVRDNDLQAMANTTPAIDNVQTAANQLREYNLIHYDEQHSLYDIHSNVRSFVKREYLARALESEINPLKEAAAKRLLLSRLRMNCLTAVQYFFEIKSWLSLLGTLAKEFDISENEKLFGSANHKLEEPRAYWGMAYLFYRQGNTDLAIRYARSGKAYLPKKKSLESISLKIKFNNILAYHVRENNAYPEKAEVLIAESDQLIKQLTDDKKEKLQPEIAQHFLMISVYENEKAGGDLARAEEYGNKALEIFRKLNDKQYELKALSNLGAIYASQEKYLESIECSKEILLNNNNVDHYTYAVEAVGIVDSFIAISDFPSASHYVDVGIKHCEDYGQIYPLGILLLNAVSIDIAQESSENARKRLEDVEKHLSSSGKKPLDHALIDSGWAKVFYLEAKRGGGGMDAKKKDAKDACERVYNLASSSGNAQIIQIAKELRNFQEEIETDIAKR